MALPELARYQFEFNNFLFGEGTPYYVEAEITAMFETTMRTSDPVLPRGDGAIPMAMWAQPPTIVFPIRVISRSHSESIHDLVSQIDTAFGTKDLLWLRWKMAVQTWRRRGRVVRKYLEASPYAARSGAYKFVVAINCPDPRYYSDDVRSLLLGEYNPQPVGYDLPTDLPIDTVAPIGTGDQIAVIEGPQTVWPVIRVYVASGQLTGFDVLNTTHGTQLTIRNISADPGDTVICDFDAYHRLTGAPVISIDGSPIHSAWQQPRIPFVLHPGGNTLRFVAYGTTEATCRVDWYDTYL
jgi:hypothetical protein